MSLMATRWFKVTCSADQTVPMPPRPSSRSSRYLPAIRSPDSSPATGDDGRTTVSLMVPGRPLSLRRRPPACPSTGVSALPARGKRVGESEQLRAAVPAERAAVHAGEQPWLERRELLDVRPHHGSVREVVHGHAHRLARSHELALGHGGVLVAELREQIAAEERFRA